MTAPYILGALAAIFLAVALRRLARDGGTLSPQTRTWLLVAAIFGVVAVYLFASV